MRISSVAALILGTSAVAVGASDIANLSGVYAVTRDNIVFNSAKQSNEPLKTEDCLELKEVWEKQLAFHFVVYGANGHTCEMQGIAMQRKHGLYEYREPSRSVPDQDCVLKIHVSDTAFELEDAGQQCGTSYCGVRAGIDSTFPILKQTGRNQCRNWLKG